MVLNGLNGSVWLRATDIIEEKVALRNVEGVLCCVCVVKLKSFW